MRLHSARRLLLRCRSLGVASLLVALTLAMAGLAKAEFIGAVQGVGQSAVTDCPEHDNINIPLFVPTYPDALVRVSSFVITAQHPVVPIGEPIEPDLSECPAPDPLFDFDALSEPVELYNDGTTRVLAHRDAQFWQASGMTAGSNGVASSETDLHYITVQKSIGGGDFAEVMKVFTDGNVQVKPLPNGAAIPDFGSSVIVGPTTPADRPLAKIDAIDYDPATDSLAVTYSGGQKALLTLEEAGSETTSVRVDVNYALAANQAFAVFRSTHLADGNSEVDHVNGESFGSFANLAILDFEESLSQGFFFHRETASGLNAAAPDLTIAAFLQKLVADANGDNKVTAADYTLWANSSGQEPPPFADGDFDGDGVVGPLDYLLWEQNFGAVPPGPPQAVPEPATVVPALMGLLGLGLSRLRRRR